MFKVLRNGLLRYVLYTCPNLWCSSCSKCYGMDCFGIYFTHVQTCDVTPIQSATEWTASVCTLHMSKPVMQLVFKVLRNGLLRCVLYTCVNLWCNSCSKCYGMDCFGAYFTHVQTCDVTRVQSARNGRPNPVIMKYCRQWQWRFENASCLDLCKITAKMFRS